MMNTSPHMKGLESSQNLSTYAESEGVRRIVGVDNVGTPVRLIAVGSNCVGAMETPGRTDARSGIPSPMELISPRKGISLGIRSPFAPAAAGNLN